jgi:hypothetical protein
LARGIDSQKVTVTGDVRPDRADGVHEVDEVVDEPPAVVDDEDDDEEHAARSRAAAPSVAAVRSGRCRDGAMDPL